jgi:hypothetical protein
MIAVVTWRQKVTFQSNVTMEEITLSLIMQLEECLCSLFRDAKVPYEKLNLVGRDDAILWSTGVWLCKARVYPTPEGQKWQFGFSTKKTNENQKCSSKGE